MSILPAERLAITLRYLATGNSQVKRIYDAWKLTDYIEVSLSFNFRVGRSTVCCIVKETCEVIWTVLQPQYVLAPSSAEEWKGISKQFEQLWNFPNCIGMVYVILTTIHRVN